MCTLIALHRKAPGVSLVVAANRDEFLTRPAEGPALRATASGPIVAPLDLEAGGTWLGLNARGVFAGVTNVSCAEPDPDRRSRGLLVVDALAAKSAREAAEKMQNVPIAAYNPFNLLIADGEGAYAFTYEDAPRRVEATDGIFVIGNGPLDAPVPSKLVGLRQRVARAAEASCDGVLEPLSALCRDHTMGARGALDALCVHTPHYGTRSSALLRLSENGLCDSRSLFRFADGAPCETGYQDFTPLLRDLGRACPGVEGAERGPAT